MRMTVRQLRQVIRETIQEAQRDRLMREGFMDSVKGLFGGGTKGAAKLYRKKLYDMYSPNKYEGSSSSDWWEMNQGIEEDFGSRVHEKFEKIFQNGASTSCAGFYDAFLRAISKVLQDPETLVGKGGGMFEDYLVEGAEALEKGDMKTAKYNLQQLLGRQAGVVWNTFKAEPLAEEYLERANEADATDRRIKRDVELDKEVDTWRKGKEKEAEAAADEEARGNRRAEKAKRADDRRAWGAEAEFNDEQERAREKSWGKKTRDRSSGD